MSNIVDRDNTGSVNINNYNNEPIIKFVNKGNGNVDINSASNKTALSVTAIGDVKTNKFTANDLTVNNLVVNGTTTGVTCTSGITTSSSSKGITLKYKNGSIDDTIYYNISGVIAKPDAISCGNKHTAILLNTGKVLTFGLGINGQLGTGDTTDRYSPYGVTDASGYDYTNAVAVLCGREHTAILLNTGKVLAFGSETRGQLGNGITGSGASSSSPIGITDASGYVSNNAVAVSCGQEYTAILLNTGKVVTFGDNGSGQLGYPHTNTGLPYGVMDAYGYDSTNAIAVSCGGFHTAILLNTGKVLTFGLGSDGQLGNGTTTNSSSPTGVTDASGYDHTNAVAVSCGSYHTAILLNTGKVVTFGKGQYGVLGTGNTTNRSSPTGVIDASGYDHTNAIAVSCGYLHTAILLNTGKVLTFGEANNGRLGDGQSTTDRNSPTVVTDASGYDHTNAIAVSCGGYHTSILLNTGKVLTFGQANNGKLGDGQSTTDRNTSYGVTDASGYASSNALTVSKYTINTGFDLSQKFSGGIRDNFNQMTTNHELNNYKRLVTYDNSDISITASLPVNNSSFKKSGIY